MFNDYKENIMQVTKNIIKFIKMLIDIHNECNRIWYMSENRWGYRKVKR